MTHGATYQEICPQKEQLKKLIKLYYTHRSDDQAAWERITYYPNYTVTLNIYRHSKVRWDAFSRTHTTDPDNPFLILLVGKFDRSREIIQEGAFDKLTIVFHPLGFNHFLPAPLSLYVRDHFSFFDAFGPAFEQLMEQVFAAGSLVQKRDLLDAFFCRQLLSFPEQRLRHAVHRILTDHEPTPIGQLASELGLSRKSLYRLFQQHLAYAPREYRSVVKFRKALDAYQNERTKPSFAALAYAANYYDQSDLNFHFKAKTGLTPSELFGSLQTIEQGLYWSLSQKSKTSSDP